MVCPVGWGRWRKKYLVEEIEPLPEHLLYPLKLRYLGLGGIRILKWSYYYKLSMHHVVHNRA